MAVPTRPKISPTASAASAPTQTADQLTGQFTTSHRCTTLDSGIASSSCRLREGILRATRSGRLLAATLEPGKDLALVEVHETRLIGADLMEEDVVVARVGIFAQRFQMVLGLGSAHYRLRDGVLRHELRHRLEVTGEAELPGEGGVHGRDRPALLRHPSRLALVLAPAHRELAVAGFARAARLSEAADERSIRLGADQPVAEGGGDLHALLTARRHHERRRRGRKGVEPCVLHHVEGAAIALETALPQEPDDVNGLGQARLTHVRLRPSLADDVLVQVFPGAHAQEETSRHHGRGGGGSLRDNGGMHPHRRAGHRRPEPEPCGGEPDRADHAPHERALPLSIDPRVEMIGDHGEAESVLLRHAGEPHQLVRAVLFARELVTNLHQGIPAPRPRPVTRWMMSITTPITKRIQAICEATCATPKSPRSPAMRPTTRKMSA